MLFALGVGLIACKWFQGYPGAFVLTLPMVVLAGMGWIAGISFAATSNGGAARRCCA